MAYVHHLFYAPTIFIFLLGMISGVQENSRREKLRAMENSANDNGEDEADTAQPDHRPPPGPDFLDSEEEDIIVSLGGTGAQGMQALSSVFCTLYSYF